MVMKRLGIFESPNIDSYFGLSSLKISMLRLSGREICDIARMFGSTLEYAGMKSRWQYMFDLIDYGIKSERIDSILVSI